VRGYETAPPTPKQIFEKLVNKNAINPKLGGGPSLQFFPESLDPSKDFGKNFKYPLLDFQLMFIYEI
jgi:hypothetical protein